jgi:hypothetical protein
MPYKKKLLWLGVIIVILIAINAYLFFVMPDKPSGPYVRVGSEVVAVDIADEPEERRQGLSGRARLGEDEGMLFVFSDKAVRSFWMPDMNFGLDMIWVKDDRIVHITREASPGGDNPIERYSSQLPVNYVLEVNAGYAEKKGIEVGDRVEIQY